MPDTPFISYSYSYPHKTAYRAFDKELSIAEIFSQEPRDALFLYMHVPFCEMRCGFCNLFTISNPKDEINNYYIDIIERQAKIVKDAIGSATFVRFAIGGGTPTFIGLNDLNRLLTIAEKIFNIDIAQVPTSIETSPLTATKEKLKLLKDSGVSRISIGIQSFIESETNAIGRTQKLNIVQDALTRIKATDFATFNIDLIYGIPEQTEQSWLHSLKSAISFQPTELYLYPLYIRPLTGIHRISNNYQDQRLNLYRVGRAFLRANGYQQVSMRMFKLDKAQQNEGPVYCCQDDGMIGLGSGARSYTRNYHYSYEYAVSSHEVKGIIKDYLTTTQDQFKFANYGFYLDQDEQKRRYVIQSILQSDGLNLKSYQDRFGSDVCNDLPQLNQLIGDQLAYQKDDIILLNDHGMEQSDRIGTLFYSEQVKNLMQSYQMR